MNTFWKKHFTSPVINYMGSKISKSKFTKAPILIGGCGRSGTTLLLSVLSAHPNVFAFPHEVDAHTSWVKKSGKLIPERLDRLHRYLITKPIPREVQRWCEKRPYNVLYIREILSYYGEQAKFIHIVRDPRAVCTSVHPEKPTEYWISIDRWIRDVSAGLTYIDHPQVFTLKYEELILNTRDTISEICKFADLEPVPQIFDWLHNATVRNNRAWFGELHRLQTDSLHKWKDPKHRNIVEYIVDHKEVHGLMKKLGYQK